MVDVTKTSSTVTFRIWNLAQMLKVSENKIQLVCLDIYVPIDYSYATNLNIPPFLKRKDHVIFADFHIFHEL